MSDTPKPKAAAKAAPSPTEALEAALANLITAAEAFAAADGTTSHSFAAGEYRIRFQGNQLLKVERA
ncbi:hypothetical protein [Sphingomonas desiccabilis]|uniref:Uncharacterized protein n=1 Tax=Sphingomonas desiccabilis TaxID=429134 RepID=A0A4Q2IW40_9SPHN|nr:hypothetical protein [Sphingomonas desiccabilis]MBB3910120.1 hypothetical protein [Sphingomonas desiccabilis]RXZ34805.1 hypothetical protein EO081_03870 [Sphingomonas desiccabilis]